MIHGYSTPLYILPFDHRASFRTGMFGWTGAPNPDQRARVAAKHAGNGLYVTR